MSTLQATDSPLLPPAPVSVCAPWCIRPTLHALRPTSPLQLFNIVDCSLFTLTALTIQTMLSQIQGRLQRFQEI